MKNKKQAFTLVELIVVIIILAILGTIAFISLQGYSQSSRDSVRISDISSMKSALEYFYIDNGKYPQPTDSHNVTYSGAIVWNQGVFGENVYINTSKLNKIPIDPLTESYYTYSVTSSRSKYQLGGVVEGDPVALKVNKDVYAAGTLDGTAIVSGTYNGQATKSLSGSTCYMINMPTIIASDLDTDSDLISLTNSGKLVYNGYKNLPSSYKTSKFKIDGGFDFQPNKYIAYTDTGSCSNLLATDPTARIELIKGIQDGYSGTILKTKPEIAKILNLVIDVNNPTEELKNIAGAYVNNNLGGAVAISNTTTTPTGNTCGTIGTGGLPICCFTGTGFTDTTSKFGTGTTNYCEFG